MTTGRFVSLCLSMLLAAGCASARSPIPPVPVPDLPRFMGRWYVIASIPTRYERGGHNPVETYSLDPDGTICTWFRMRPEGFDAPVKLLHSSASVVQGTGNGQWRVHLFAFLSAQYVVGWLKPDYSQVMVVRDARDYLWYMARTPQVGAADYQAMLDRAAAMGYDVTRIAKAPQHWPETGAGSQTFAGACP
ncbi:MAG TPA: lipocalin family protein [Frateuria sp.]|uniref:lipocalin family protein n=1 Tax=Frateuria sp. TaxID=2211372 RepID=UPI002DECFC97|nr:lipocalin family protein [Frateuria sp.]